MSTQQNLHADTGQSCTREDAPRPSASGRCKWKAPWNPHSHPSGRHCWEAATGRSAGERVEKHVLTSCCCAQSPSYTSGCAPTGSESRVSCLHTHIPSLLIHNGQWVGAPLSFDGQAGQQNALYTVGNFSALKGKGPSSPRTSRQGDQPPQGDKPCGIPHTRGRGRSQIHRHRL